MKKASLIFIVFLILFGGCDTLKPKEEKKEVTTTKKTQPQRRRKRRAEPEGSKSIILKEIGMDTKKGVEGVKLGKLEIEMGYPLTVRSGTLMSIKGEGFGIVPTPIIIGEIVVNEFLEWSDDIIWLQVPEGVKDGDKIKIGNQTSSFALKIASENAIKVIWELDLNKLKELMKDKYERYELIKTPEFKLPLYIKGQWVKKQSGFGNYSSSWDNGSKTQIYNVKGTDKWISECYFTEENFERFKLKEIYFAFEDSNVEQRKL